MEENKELIEGILKRSSEPKAPAHLSANIMDAWKKEQESTLVIAPLISKRVWALVTAFLAGLLYIALRAPQGDAAPSPLADSLKEMKAMFSFDLIDSPVVLLSILAMVLMIFLNIWIVNGPRSFGRLSIL